jgi:hypothetical protein
VQIVADRSITFRGTLRPDDAQPERPASQRTDIPRPPAQTVAPPPSSTFYVIPGCYLGNVAPTAATLPPGCDPGQLKTYRP